MKYPQWKHELEPEILSFWQENKILEGIRERNESGKAWCYLDGPPYTSGKLHLGQVWNRALKDIMLRYKRMQGYHVWDRAGYDMHGLPTEHKVMAKLGLSNKKDIKNFGLLKFTDECYKWSTEIAAGMNKDQIRMGFTFDFKDPYMPVKPDYIEAEWFLIKKAHEKGRLYKGFRTLYWDAEDETALAKHETEYKQIIDPAIYVKFRIEETDNKYLVIWTTTPWTIAFNMGIMVNPNIEYTKIETEGEIWFLADELVKTVMEEYLGKPYKILDKFKGEKLKGTKYVHPWFDEITPFAKLKKEFPNTHTVVLSSEFVTTDTGTGLVHTAPGCGPEDYEIGHKNNIPPFNNLDEQGIYPANMGVFSGLKAKKDDNKFIEKLKERKALVHEAVITHDYPHGQRSKKPVIFRATPQWFFKIEDLKPEMLQAAKNTHWIPETAKNAYLSWLENLRDNSITKQRYWGTPVPIWECKNCKNITVIGSLQELKEKAGILPEKLHIPTIDSVELMCSCGSTQKRVPDVLDVWIDAGCAAWACLYYPQKKMYYDQFYPADFILEGKDQIRGWFNMLMIASIIALNKPAFKNVHMHGFLTDIEGIKMSKSLGNIISPYEVADKYGVDTLRYYVCQTNAGNDLSYSWDEIKLKNRYLQVIWNTHKYLLEFSKQTGNPYKLDKNLIRIGLEEKYIESRLHSSIKKVTNLLNEYRIDEIIEVIEKLFLDISRTYIQLVREKATFGNKEEKEGLLYTLNTVFFDSLKMLSTIAPFISEAIYQNLQEFGLTKKSIHEHNWPEYLESKIKPEIEQQISLIDNITQASANLREKIKLNLRWPLKEIVIVGTDISNIKNILLKQLNVKTINTSDEPKFVKIKVKANYKTLGPKYGEKTAGIIAKMTIESPITMLKHLKSEGKYKIKVNNEEFEILNEDIIKELAIEEPYIGTEFKEGTIYINKERTPELDAEGFLRETTRKIQQARKDNGLDKTDKISLALQVSPKMRDHLQQSEEEIRTKVGSTRIKISENEPLKNYEYFGKAKIKNEEIKWWFQKII